MAKKLLECTDCGGQWMPHPKIQSWSEYCPFCTSRKFFTALHLFMKNAGKAGHLEARFCTCCGQLLDAAICHNCHCPEFTHLDLRGFYLDDCFFDPTFESSGQSNIDPGSAESETNQGNSG